MNNCFLADFQSKIRRFPKGFQWFVCQRPVRQHAPLQLSFNTPIFMIDDLQQKQRITDWKNRLSFLT
ncbi:hypothetical protein L3Y34_004791 [Caenorhabditis briggsae]|uniref:Uncharacterized protein n=1 Tax=Caenorhabditis briggsae TaxID=6238 RepID=A0AAE9ACM9_CAEBR|nr:hypothetical protein L3Y34_004791 [Caenorhabditis briggsae]